MSVDAISSMNSYAAADSGSVSNSSAGEYDGSDLSMNDFFTLLAAQLQYQDPTQPTDNSQFMSQMAQFAELEQVQDIAKNLTISQSAGMIGQNVVFTETDSDNNVTEYKGTITAVDTSNSSSSGYYVGGVWITPSQIVGYYQIPPDSTVGTGDSGSSGDSGDSGTGGASGT